MDVMKGIRVPERLYKGVLWLCVFVSKLRTSVLQMQFPTRLVVAGYAEDQAGR